MNSNPNAIRTARAVIDSMNADAPMTASVPASIPATAAFLRSYGEDALADELVNACDAYLARNGRPE